MKSILLATVATLGVAGDASAATIQNGSFESSSVSGNFSTYYAGNIDLTGWTIVSGSLDHIRNYWKAQDGNQSLDMSGDSAATIMQSITDLMIGTTYQLSFWLSGNPGGPAVKSLTAAVGGVSEVFTFDSSNSSPGNMGWVQRSLEFTASATSADLYFTSNTPGYNGPALDNVTIVAVSSVTPVPAPAAGLLLLGGLGGLVAAGRRRKA